MMNASIFSAAIKFSYSARQSIMLSFIFIFYFCQASMSQVLKLDSFSIKSTSLFALNWTNLPTILMPDSNHGPGLPFVQKDVSFITKRTLNWILYYDFFTTLTALHNRSTAQSSEVNNLYVYYNVDIKNLLSYRTFTLESYFFNDLGMRHYFDSLTLKTQDQFTCRNSININLLKSTLKFSLSANVQTKLWKTYNYRYNSASLLERYLYEDYMSPGVIIYNGGLSFQLPSQGVLQFGLGSSKVNKIRNQRIFQSRNVESINGLIKGQRKKSEWGWSCTLLFPMTTIHRRVHWEFYGNVFAPFNQFAIVKQYSIDMNNVFHVVFLKFARLSWRTKVFYRPESTKTLEVQNQLSLGFYLNNHL